MNAEFLRKCFLDNSTLFNYCLDMAIVRKVLLWSTPRTMDDIVAIVLAISLYFNLK